MNKQTRSRKEIVIAIVACSLPLLLISSFTLFKIVSSPYNFAGYTAKSVTCNQKLNENACTIVIEIHNNSYEQFSPDFTGTDGPGFAESGIWGVYVIDSNGHKTQEYIDRDAYGITIPGRSSVTAPIKVLLPEAVDPRTVIIFDHTLDLAHLAR